MLDELLGRASLKARIDELEAENERLKRRYEAESERRADAVTAKQDAEERQNRLEDRIAQLEGELDRLEESSTTIDYSRRARLRGGRLEEVLDRLASVRTEPEGAFTGLVRNGADVPDRVIDLLEDRTALVEEATPCLLCTDDEGLVTVTLEPPVVPDPNNGPEPDLGNGSESTPDPGLETRWQDRFDLERSWFLPTGRYTLALVRTDLFALGTYEGGDRIDFSGFESEVTRPHSKGGFSQSRFERLRDEQVDEHLDRCRDALSAVESDRVYVVGQGAVVDTLAESIPVDPDATATVDATGKPRDALEMAHRSFWTTELRVL